LIKFLAGSVPNTSRRWRQLRSRDCLRLERSVRARCHDLAAQCPGPDPRSGLVQNQRFGGQIWAHLRPRGQVRRKNPENIIKEGAKSGGKWRFFEGQSAISPCCRPTRPGSEAVKLPELKSEKSDLFVPPAARQTGNRAPFFSFCPWSVVRGPLFASRTAGVTRFVSRLWSLARFADGPTPAWLPNDSGPAEAGPVRR